MKDYNGFTGAQRLRAQRWLTEMWSAGRLQRPVECCACGQREGALDAHAEDYSEPFAPGKTDEFHLCFRCHMMVHNRFAVPAAFEHYRVCVAGGIRFEAMLRRNWWLFRAQHLTVRVTVKYTIHDPPRHDVLGQIAARDGAQLRDPADAPG